MNRAAHIVPDDFAPPATLGRLAKVSLFVGAAFFLVSIGCALYDWSHFLRSWLLAFMFWLGPTLGSLVLLMLQYTTGGQWGRLGRRLWEAATYTLPLMALFWIPLAIGMKSLYPWTTPEKQVELGDKALYYLRPSLFVLRGILYFAGWGGLAWRLNRWSRVEEAGHATPARFVGIQNLSGAGIVFYGLSITFASIDWVMSLSPDWWSTVYGMLFMVGQCLTTFAFTILLLVWLCSTTPVSRVFKADHLHDFGKMMFAFVILWAYLSFSQWLVIWSGNIVEEIRWYLDRIRGHWQIVGIGLIVFHFALPFALLLSRNLKRQARKLIFVALLVIFMRYIDLFWLVAPNFHLPGQLAGLSPLDIVMDVVNPIALGGLWLAVFFRQLGRRALLPVHDAEFADLLEAKHG